MPKNKHWTTHTHKTQTSQAPVTGVA